MTEPERAGLRILIDRETRARLRPTVGGCAGCGGDRDGFTVGCVTCDNRRQHRRYREEGRIVSHGTSGYERGCKCGICAAARSKNARASRLRRKQRLGIAA